MPVEGRAWSPRFGPDLLNGLIPRQSRCSLSLQIVESLIEVTLLFVGQRQRFRISTQRIPKLIEKFELLVLRKTLDVDGGLAHGAKYATPVSDQRPSRRLLRRDRTSARTQSVNG